MESEPVDKRPRIDTRGPEGGVNVRRQPWHPRGDYRHAPNDQPRRPKLLEAIP
jgi:hypothetical protein